MAHQELTNVFARAPVIKSTTKNTALGNLLQVRDVYPWKRDPSSLRSGHRFWHASAPMNCEIMRLGEYAALVAY